MLKLFEDGIPQTVSPRANRIARSSTPTVTALVGAPHTYAGADDGPVWRRFHFSRLGPNQGLIGDGETLRTRCRQAYRDHPWMAAAVDKLVANVIGRGLTPRFPAHSKLDEKEQEKVMKLWRQASRELDALGVNDFGGLCRLAFRGQVRDGEMFARFRPRRRSDGFAIPLQIQLCEPDLVPYKVVSDDGRTQNIVGGIEVSPIGAPAFVWFLKEHPADRPSRFYTINDATKVAIENCLHCYEPKRANQLRGEPLAAPVVLLLHQLAIYTEAELRRKGFSSSILGFFKNIDVDRAPGADESTKDSDGNLDIAVEPGIIPSLPAGVEFQNAKSDDIQGSYPEFVSQHGKEVSTAMRVTFGQLTNDYREASFASERASLIDVRRMQEQMQQDFAFQFCAPIWRRFIDAALKENKIGSAVSDANDYYDVEWQGQGWDWVDPVKDLEADKLAIEMMVVSRDSVIRKRGGDPDEVDQDIKRGNDRMKKFGIEPEPVQAGQAAKTPPPPGKQPTRKELVQ